MLYYGLQLFEKISNIVRVAKPAQDKAIFRVYFKKTRELSSNKVVDAPPSYR